MNPCPCGQQGDPTAVCQCTPEQIRRYRGRLSGPFLDRVDMQLKVPRLPRATLRREAPEAESSATVRAPVVAARERALQRQGGPNDTLAGGELEPEGLCERAALARLDAIVDSLGLSARAYHRILRVARTIADLAQAERVTEAHVSEAVSHRSLDRRAAAVTA